MGRKRRFLGWDPTQACCWAFDWVVSIALVRTGKMKDAIGFGCLPSVSAKWHAQNDDGYSLLDRQRHILLLDIAGWTWVPIRRHDRCAATPTEVRSEIISPYRLAAW